MNHDFVIISYRLGLGSVASTRLPHPGDNNIIVIFVIGGLSYKEVGQIRSVVDNHLNNQSTKDPQKLRIIIGSNKLFVPEDILLQI